MKSYGCFGTACMLCILGAFVGVASAQEGELGEITVTATRRSESLQDVPIAISALSAADLANSGVNANVDLGEQVPGLNVGINGTSIAPHIRGIGPRDSSSGAESSIAIYEDGVYVAEPAAGLFNFNNIDHVEVLKGPQGTLFGRNATGGVIQVVTLTPSTDSNAFGSVSYGNYETMRGNLYATTGFGDRLAGDIAVAVTDRWEGYGINVDTGSPFGLQKETQVRSKWLYRPTDDTRITAWVSYIDSHAQQNEGRQFLPGAYGLDGVTTYTGNWYNISGNVDPQVAEFGRVGALTIEHDFSPFTLKSISAYQTLRVAQNFDNDNTPLSIVDVYDDDEQYRTLTEELQLISNPESKIKWVAGAFFMNAAAGYAGPQGLGLVGDGLGLPPGLLGVGIKQMIGTKSWAEFGEVTLPLMQGTELVLGARYTRDERKLWGETDVFGASVQDIVSRSYINPILEKTFDKPTYRAILNHRFNDEVMAYASYSTGFKSGNFNTVAPANPAYEPETLKAVELGTKMDLLERRLRLDLSAFHYQYDDIQLAVDVGNSEFTENASSAVLYGGELQGTALITDLFSINFGTALLHSRVGYFPNAICLIPQAVGDLQVTCNATGNRLPRAPQFTANASPTVTVPLPMGKVRASIGYFYTSSFDWDYSNIRQQSGYHLLNASLGWNTSDDRFGVRIYGENITGTRYSIYTPAQGEGDTFNAGLPFMYGVEFNFNLKPRHP